MGTDGTLRETDIKPCPDPKLKGLKMSNGEDWFVSPLTSMKHSRSGKKAFAHVLGSLPQMAAYVLAHPQKAGRGAKKASKRIYKKAKGRRLLESAKRAGASSISDRLLREYQ